jgi:hypothetical protein
MALASFGALRLATSQTQTGFFPPPRGHTWERGIHDEKERTTRDRVSTQAAKLNTNWNSTGTNATCNLADSRCMAHPSHSPETFSGIPALGPKVHPTAVAEPPRHNAYSFNAVKVYATLISELPMPD